MSQLTPTAKFGPRPIVDPGRKTRDEVGQLQRRHGNMAGPGQNRDDLHRRLRPLRFHPLDDRLIAEQSAMESHGATNDRRKGIVAQNDAIACSLEIHGDGGCNLVGPEDNGERRRLTGIEGWVAVAHRRSSVTGNAQAAHLMPQIRRRTMRP
jgi:hypothetical protein